MKGVEAMKLITRVVSSVAVAALVSLLGVSAAHAQAQPPFIDHYHVYNVEPNYSVGLPVILRDQFGEENTVVQFLERFSNPVDKNGEGIIDSLLHYSWWRIDNPEPIRSVLITNQFGPDQPWQVGDAMYLLNPAYKNYQQPGGQPPVANHYKCYRALGPPIQKDVVLIDQFGIRSGFVTAPELLCNPVEKQIPGKPPDPIIDPVAHLACYRLEPPQFYGIPATMLDQFGPRDIRFRDDCLLCVPSLKDHIVPTEPGTWSRVKGLYR
jgi:hypothetical protein